jgi:hypothetical protein
MFASEASNLSSITEAVILENLLKTDTDTRLIYIDKCGHRDNYGIKK